MPNSAVSRAMPALQPRRYNFDQTSARRIVMEQRHQPRASGGALGIGDLRQQAGTRFDKVDKSDAGAFAELINRAASKHGVDPTLVAAVAKAESNLNPKAVSHAGAKGLMQLMDGTAEMLGVTNSFDPAQNVDGGAKFLSEMLKRFKKPELALAAYNAGPGAVTKHGGIPPYKETQTYVKRVLEYQKAMV